MKQTTAKPFLKWAGGKNQLIQLIDQRIPKELNSGNRFNYIEPFIGGGAILFWILQKYKNIDYAVINDINSDLTNAYEVVKANPDGLIKELKKIEKEFYSLNSLELKKQFYLEKRTNFNEDTNDKLFKTSILIFLNKTCFNGLYRVNSKNKFNVPYGNYTTPKICDTENIIEVSKVLQDVIILNGDYEKVLNHSNTDSFIYLDPPYKPISNTSSFNSYSKESFNDNEQVRLSMFCENLSRQNIKWLLSNSDPKNTDSENNFFENLYQKNGNSIQRINAKRMINSKKDGRGDIFELLISNY